MRTIQIPHITLVLQDTEGGTTGTITSDLKEPCRYCGQPGCNYDCDESTASDTEEDEARAIYNAAIDGFESLVLAAACADVDVRAKSFINAVNTAVDAIANKYD